MDSTTPQKISAIIINLESSDQAILRSYIDGLKSKINVDEDPQKEPITAEEVEGGNDEESLSSELEDEDLLPPMFKSGDDDVDIDTMDKATAYKMEASDLKSAGDYKSALKKFNLAVTTAPPSALLLANRADVLLKLGQYKTAVKDCNAALQKNPDSAKALRIHGKAYKALEEYEKARKDLSASQAIDYDGSTVEDMKFVTEKMKEIEAAKVKKKLEKERKRKIVEEMKKRQEEEESGVLRHLVLNDLTRRITSSSTITNEEYSGSKTLETVKILQSSNISCIGEHAFRDCTSLRSVHIEDTVTYIERCAFRGCSSLRSVRFPNGLTNIEDCAFAFCSSLQSAHLPDELTAIGNVGFGGCTSLQSVHLPDDMTIIGHAAFGDCTSLRKINLPAGLITIGEGTFEKCTSLKFIHIPDGVKTIQEGAFEDCTALESLYIGDTVTTIGLNAFLHCRSLQAVHLPAELTSIGEQAFGACSSLQSIHIPYGVTTIEKFTFADCSSLLSVHLPAGLATIESKAFDGCSLVASILIPDTVTKRALNAFDNCSILQRRQRHHPTYHKCTVSWLRQRFSNLPIHLACYNFGYNNTSSSTTSLDDLSTLIQENKQTLTTADAMGMTPLHILCYNPHATAETMQIIVEGEPSLVTHVDVTGCTPLQVFLMCRSLVQAGQSIPSIHNLLEKGLKCEDLAIVSVLASNGEINMSSQDEKTGLSPFMTAATVSACGLDAVYTLAMRNIESMI